MGFKVGDKVKIIGGPTSNKIGEIGYVFSIYPPHIRDTDLENVLDQIAQSEVAMIQCV